MNPTDTLKILKKNMIILFFKSNKLALNESKTNFIVFHTKSNKPPDDFRISLNSIDLKRVTNTKFLGVKIQENLSWKTHIDFICDRVSRTTGVLARLKHFLPKHALLLIFNSLCVSHMTYAITVWGAAPKLQRKCCIFGALFKCVLLLPRSLGLCSGVDRSVGACFSTL